MQKVADAIILTGSNQILLVKRIAGDDEGGLWSLPGGVIKEDRESISEGLKREIKEELGIDIDNFNLFESSRVIGFIIYYFVVHIENPKVILNKMELDAFNFFNYEEIFKIGKLAFSQEDIIKKYFKSLEK